MRGDPANDTTTRGQAPLQLGPTRIKKGERKTLRARLIADFWPHRVVQQTEGTLLLSTLPSFVKKGDELAIDVSSIKDQVVSIVIIGSTNQTPIPLDESFLPEPVKRLVRQVFEEKKKS